MYANRLQAETFRSVDTIPIFNWWQIHKTQDLSYLLIDGNCLIKPGIRQAALTILWERLYDAYIERFGFGESLLRILEKKKNVARLKVEKMITEDWSIQTFIDIEETEIRQLTEESSGENDFYVCKVAMERMLGFTLDPRRVTVAEFNAYIYALQKSPPQ